MRDLANTEEGFSLTELLVAMLLIAVVMMTTFAVLNRFGNATRQNFSQNEAQSVARSAVDRLARDLRNAAGPGTSTAAVERATGPDLVFLTVDPLSPGSGSNTASVERVRYCLDSAAALWRQVQTWNSSSVPAISSATGCPDSGFGSQAKVAADVVNRAGSQNRALFAYDSATASSIRSITIDVYVDKDTANPPSEQRLTTSVFLRNQNRAPVAGFSATPTGSHHVLLNGSASTDADGDALTYTWYDGGTAIGTGAVLDYASPTTGSHSFSVKVTDPAGLNNTSLTQAVDVT